MSFLFISDPDPAESGSEMIISDPDPDRQKVSDPAGFGSGSTTLVDRIDVNISVRENGCKTDCGEMQQYK